MEKIKIGIVGYGNIGKAVHSNIASFPDMELTAIFTRRDPETVNISGGVQVASMQDLPSFQDKIDVMMLCGGSATDLPEQGPMLAKMFNTVDSFDTHSVVGEYYKVMDAAAKQGGKVAVISTGWDPGLFSIMRGMFAACLPAGNTYSFWGKGVSQGHSQAVRAISGVAEAIQYTIPNEKSKDKIRNFEYPKLTVKDKHSRVCYVVLEENANTDEIENEIKAMPAYFAEYDTSVNFITQEEFNAHHKQSPHAGCVIRTGETSNNQQLVEFSLKLNDNPTFTASVMLAYARAAARYSKQGETGAKTVLEIPPFMLHEKPLETLISEIL